MKRVLAPEELSPGELDWYLGQGWFRIGQTLITCRALLIQETLLSTVWTRTELSGFRFKSSLRRAMRRVEERFRVEVVPARIDEEHEALYQRYLTTTDGSRARTLRHFLHDDGEDRGLFDTWEVRIQEGDTLVAFSLFDRGEESLQSLIGVYEPALARYGLGFYTMLREVQYGVESGRRHFYAGYVLPGEPMMDYKLRTGAIWFLDERTGAWRPWEEASPHGYIPPVERLRAALTEASRRLGQRRVPHQLKLNPMFELPAHTPSLNMCLDQPLTLECYPERHAVGALLVTWDVERETYRLLHALRTPAHPKNRPEERIELLVVVEEQEISESVEELVEAVIEAGEEPAG